MLFLAQSDRGALARDLVEVSVANEVRRSADFLDMLFEDAGATLEIVGDARARVNASLLQRAITNLLGNALQHGLHGRPVAVEIGDEAGVVTIAVRNEADPLSTAQMDRLFDRFYRVDSARADSRQNHGLGLAIVKAIATMHGGAVFARQSRGVVCIGLTLPALPPQAPAPDSLPPLTQAATA